MMKTFDVHYIYSLENHVYHSDVCDLCNTCNTGNTTECTDDTATGVMDTTDNMNNNDTTEMTNTVDTRTDAVDGSHMSSSDGSHMISSEEKDKPHSRKSELYVIVCKSSDILECGFLLTYCNRVPIFYIASVHANILQHCMKLLHSIIPICFNIVINKDYNDIKLTKFYKEDLFEGLHQHIRSINNVTDPAEINVCDLFIYFIGCIYTQKIKNIHISHAQQVVKSTFSDSRGLTLGSSTVLPSNRITEESLLSKSLSSIPMIKIENNIVSFEKKRNTVVNCLEDEKDFTTYLTNHIVIDPMVIKLIPYKNDDRYQLSRIIQLPWTSRKYVDSIKDSIADNTGQENTEDKEETKKDKEETKKDCGVVRFPYRKTSEDSRIILDSPKIQLTIRYLSDLEAEIKIKTHLSSYPSMLNIHVGYKTDAVTIKYTSISHSFFESWLKEELT